MTLLLPSLGRAELIIDQVFSHILSTLKINFPRVKLWIYGVSEGSGEIPDILAEILQSKEYHGPLSGKNLAKIGFYRIFLPLHK